MSKNIIEVENLSKLYRLGSIGSATFRDSLERWWSRVLNKPSKIALTVDSGDPRSGPEPNTMWALKDVSFSVREGETLGIIGNNGAGKSTMLKILSRITEPTLGRAIMRGRSSSLLEVGTGFHPELTGRENIYLNGTILGMRKTEIDRKFDEIVEFSEIEKFIDTPVKRYSSGMYVRLAFAVAAHLEPEILIVDEVLSVGDIVFQKKCLGKMEKVSGEGRTVILVSHNMSAISNLCHKTILIQKGKIEKDGLTRDVISYYQRQSEEIASSAGEGGGVWSTEDNTEGRDYIIEKIELIDPHTGKRKLTLNMNDAVTFRLHYYANKDNRELNFALIITNSLGIKMIEYNTYYDSVETPIKKGRGYIDCFFSNWVFTAGNYYIGVRICDALMDYRCENYGLLTVNADYHMGSQIVYSSDRCAVYLPHKWELVN